MQASRHFAFATAVAIVLVVAAPGSAPVLASTPKQTAASTNVAATGTYAQREIFGFALVIVVLYTRPGGLFGRTELRRV